MLVLVRGDPALTKAEVTGLDIMSSRHPQLYSLIVKKLGYKINPTTNVVSNSHGHVDETCRPDATGRQICLKPSVHPTDVINILMETGGFRMSAVAHQQGTSVLVWSLSKEKNCTLLATTESAFSLDMASASNLYKSVVDDVVNGARGSFENEAVDERVLQELKRIWVQKLNASKTVEPILPAGQQQEAVPDVRPTVAVAAVAAVPSPRVVSVSKSAAPVADALAAATSIPPASVSGPRVVVINVSKLVPVRITIPPQPGVAGSQPRSMTLSVPAQALQQPSPASGLFHKALANAIGQALKLPDSHAAAYLQTEVNRAFGIN